MTLNERCLLPMNQLTIIEGTTKEDIKASARAFIQAEGRWPSSYWPLSWIKALPRNAKEHDIPGICASIAEHGFLDPLGVNLRTDHNLDGNGRLEALIAMYSQRATNPPKGIVLQKYTTVTGVDPSEWLVPVTLFDIPVDREDEIGLALNRLNQTGGFNQRQVYELLIEASARNRLTATGYDAAALAELATRYAPPPNYTGPSPNGAGSTGTGVPGNSSPNSAPGTESQEDGTDSSNLDPSRYPRMVQIFLTGANHPVFIERCEKLLENQFYFNEENQPCANLTELIFSLVKLAAEGEK